MPTRVLFRSVERFKTEAFDYVITLCDEARGACASMRASVENIHWNITDPLKCGDSDERVFREALWEIRRRVELFVTVARARAREQNARP
jgi:protein-tyrosine-phosphatase